MRNAILLIILIAISANISAQSFLQVPIEGDQREDWTIVNYVDWELEGFVDHNCGSKSYDGHQGTDFTIRSFADMDDNVAVYAAAAGTVTYTIDGLFDRETEGDESKGLGNYIAISHANDYYTYYGHLKLNSIQVNVGESVNAGDLIGYVGSSGNSTDPHLHFELWYDSLYVVDPFAGDCGNELQSFIDPPIYETELTVWESGMHLTNNLNINDLRERIVTLEEPYTISPDSDSQVYFWSHMYGLRKDKVITIQWFTPDDEEWFEFSVTLDRDYWYYYYWSFINHVNLPEGNWTVRLLYDGTEVANEKFEVAVDVSNVYSTEMHYCQKYSSWSINKLSENTNLDFQVINSNGQSIPKERITQLPSGIYFIQITKNNEICTFKKWIN